MEGGVFSIEPAGADAHIRPNAGRFKRADVGVRPCFSFVWSLGNHRAAVGRRDPTPPMTCEYYNAPMAVAIWSSGYSGGTMVIPPYGKPQICT